VSEGDRLATVNGWPLRQLGLPKRVYNAIIRDQMERRGISWEEAERTTRVAALSGYSTLELFRVPGCGVAALKAVREALAVQGLRLPTPGEREAVARGLLPAAESGAVGEGER
jgi:hypothetical protein